MKPKIYHLPLHLLSNALKSGYNTHASPKPTNMPMSPVPEFAIGPVYQTWDMHGMTTPKAQRKDSNAASPSGRRRGTFQEERS